MILPIIRIENPLDPSLDPFCRIPDFRLRKGEWRSTPCFLTESTRDFALALNRGYVLHSVFLEDSWLDSVSALIADAKRNFPDINVFTVSHDVYALAMGSERSYGLMGLFERPVKSSLSSILNASQIVCIAENIVNAENIGSLFKAANAFGIDALLLTHSSHDPLYRRSLRVSKGASFEVSWARIGSSNDWAGEGIDILHSFGFRVVSLALRDDAVSLESLSFGPDEKVAIVVGSEGPGLLDTTIEGSDAVALIPMRPGIDSLNVSAAASVAFWQLGNLRI